MDVISSSSNQPLLFSGSWLRRRAIDLAALVSLVALSGIGRAQAKPSASPTVPLRVTVTSPFGCPGEAELFDKVHSRLPVVRAPASYESAYGATVQVTAVADGGCFSAHEARIVLVDPRGVEAKRTLSGPSCDQVIEAAALVVALDLESRVRPPEPDRKSEPPAKPNAPPKEPDFWAFSFAATTQLRGDVASGYRPAYGGWIELLRASNRYPLLPRLLAVGVTTSEGDAVDTRLRIMAPFLATCPFFAFNPKRTLVAACFRIELGRHSGTIGNHTYTHTMSSFSLSAQGRYRIWGGLWLDSQVGALGRLDAGTTWPAGPQDSPQYRVPVATLILNTSLVYTFL